MKIRHVSTNDINGGAARAAYRLHLGLKSLNLDSSMVVLNKSSIDKNIHRVKNSAKIYARILRTIRREFIKKEFQSYHATRYKGLELFSDDRTEYKNQLNTFVNNSDILNLHWVANFVDFTSFFMNIPQNKPVVWTLHDMNPFTGGCHYNVSCDRFTEQCGHCPQLGSNKSNDLSFNIWKRKKHAFDRLNDSCIQIVTPSNWLAGEVKRSSLLKRFKVSVIHYGLDTNKYIPCDKKSARKVLNLPENHNIVLFVAESLQNKRKGLELLIKALDILKNNNIFLLSVGNTNTDLINHANQMHLGNLSNDNLLPIVYSVADVFVIPSLQDNLPNTVLEAMACGTPVVGFNTGGIPDMVKPYDTGLLANTGDAVDLAKKIQWLLENDVKRKEMGKNSRQMIENHFRLDIQAKKYYELYNNMLQNSK